MSRALSSDRERPPRFLSANFSQLFTAQGNSPVDFDFFLSSVLALSADLCFLAFALKPIYLPPKAAYSILGSHCLDASPSWANKPSNNLSKPRRVTSDTFATLQMSDWVLDVPDSEAAL